MTKPSIQIIDIQSVIKKRGVLQISGYVIHIIHELVKFSSAEW